MLNFLPRSVNLDNPPSHVLLSRLAPLPSEPPKETPFGVSPRPLLSEVEAPLVLGAISHRSYRQAFLKRPLAFGFKPSSVKVVRHFEFKGKPEKSSKRGEIDGFSSKSKKRLRLAAVDAFPTLTSMFVCTYPDEFPSDGRESKRQLDVFLKAFRRKFKGFGYLWVLEFQKRGAPHYHLFTALPVNDENKKWLAETWCRIACSHDYEKAMAVHTGEKAFITWTMGTGAYLAKYLDKANQKYVPEGYFSVGRFWGSSRGLTPKPIWIEADAMTAAYQDSIRQPVQTAVRILTRYYQNSTSYWKKDEKGNLYKARKSRNGYGASIYSFTLIQGKQVFLEITRWYDRRQRGRLSFNEWAKQTGG